MGARLKELLSQQLAGLESVSENAFPDQEESNQLTAWTTVARVLLNLDELITRE